MNPTNTDGALLGPVHLRAPEGKCYCPNPYGGERTCRVEVADDTTRFDMDGVMDIKVCAVNLDRSKGQSNAISRQGSEFTLDLIRVPGIGGAPVQTGDRFDCDERAFRRNNGRTILPGEYGCYRSHLDALNAFINVGEAIGIIGENDIEHRGDLPSRIAAAFDAGPHRVGCMLCGQSRRSVEAWQGAGTLLGDRGCHLYNQTEPRPSQPPGGDDPQPIRLQGYQVPMTEAIGNLCASYSRDGSETAVCA